MEQQRKLSLIFLFLFLISFLNLLNFSNSKIYESCDEAIEDTSDDLELESALKANIEPFKKNYSECLERMLSTGNYQSSEYLINHLHNQKIKFRDSLKKIVGQVEMNMKELYNKYRFDEEDFQRVSPALQWAQSMNQIFVQIKFSHRHDAPGCPEVKNLQVDLNPKELYLSAYCIQTDIPIKFEIRLPFYGEISPEESKHDHTANGRYIFTITKSQSGTYWERLVKENSDYPKNTKMWLEMHEKHKTELEKYLEDDEEEEYQKVLEEINKKKKKPRKKKVKFEG